MVLSKINDKVSYAELKNIDESTMTDVILTEKALKEYLDKKSKSDNIYED